MTRRHPLRTRHAAVVAALAALTVLASLSSAPARADSPRAPATPAPKAFTDECGSCHLAYPPGLLPAASWQRLMAGLPRHFGVDASVDAKAAAEIGAWLAANAATGRRADPPPQDRITQAPWFVREHREVRTATWSLPAVKGPSNCAACHTRADQGDFDERFIRIPR